jgi:hypothetical protein
MAGAMPPRVEVLRVASAGAPEQHRKRIGPVWYDYQMDVIGHERVGQHPAPCVVQLLPDQRQVHLVVGGGEEDALAVGSALGDVIGKTGYDVAGISGHTRKRVAWSAESSQGDTLVWGFH